MSMLFFIPDLQWVCLFLCFFLSALQVSSSAAALHVIQSEAWQFRDQTTTSAEVSQNTPADSQHAAKSWYMMQRWYHSLKVFGNVLFRIIG